MSKTKSLKIIKKGIKTSKIYVVMVVEIEREIGGEVAETEEEAAVEMETEIGEEVVEIEGVTAETETEEETIVEIGIETEIEIGIETEIEIEIEIGGVVAETEIEEGLTQATAADEAIILGRARAPIDAR